MCGIVGFIDKKNKFGKEKKEAFVGGMLDLIQHRGGDATGVISIKNITIGHTRLSIVDTSKNADQPFVNDNFILSYNGEIYNHNVPRKKYLAGKDLVSSSDTSTLFEILQICQIEEVLKMIKGMYAFSFLDIKKQSLVLALDKMAIKPLYFLDTPEYFAWASEIKSFSALPDFQFRLEEEKLFEHMVFRHISDEKTLFKNIFKIQQGEYLDYSLKSNTYIKNKYFELEKVGSKKQNIENILTESVKSHLMSDAPVGIQLSGGIDSSVVSYIAQKNSPIALHSFSIGLNDSEWNEFKYSDFVAKELGTIHHKIIFTKKDFVDNFEKITYHLDGPIVHPNTVPMYLLAKFARKYVKVLLTGEGADEIFLGYKRYVQKDINNDDDLLLSNAFSDPVMISKILKMPRGSLSERKQFVQKTAELSREYRLSFYDMNTYLPHVLLRQDKAGMAANIENRVPFLYESVIEAGYNLDTKIGDLGEKTPIKEIALKYFPSDFVLRKKCGFGLPISEWIKDDCVLLPYLSRLKESKLVLEYFDWEVVKKLIDEHLTGVNDHSVILFSIIGLDVWYNIFCKQ
ncbi:MAG: asparagine synthase (glutamine-hydrolyzing) [Candidatus Paceibacterota bacterium]|jgi:asparagine synthase (glutamine-hydrolysing)